MGGPVREWRAYPRMSPQIGRLFPLISGCREDQDERRPLPGLARHFDDAVVVAHDAPRNTQAKPAPPGLRGIKGFEDAFDVLCRYPWAGIPQFDAHLSRVIVGTNGN